MTPDQATAMNPALNPGDKVGYFEVQQPLAAGGMSLVWKGYDKLLNRDVAIKQIAGKLAADEAVREKFRQEAEIQKKVSAGNKNLVEVIDFIEDERGLFIVMEYVDGSSLDRMLAKLSGPMEPKQALGLIQQIALGLAAIHKAGVIHRDLKPSNILLPRDGGVKICDFGLAAIQHEQEGLTMGTARYMAPELFTEQSADPSADIYSLGMIAYEMAIGRDAFESNFKTILRDQRNQAIRWMKWHTNQRLAATPAHEINEQVPEPLSDLIERMMEKDPQKRIQSAPQLLEVLKQNFSAAGRAAAAKKQQQAASGAPGFEQSAEPTAPLPPKSKLPIILVGLLGFNLLVFGGIGVWYMMEQAEAEESQLADAEQEYDRARMLYDQGDYAEARSALLSLAGAWQDHPKYGQHAASLAAMAEARRHAELADAAREARDFATAAKHYELAIASAHEADDIGGLERDPIFEYIEGWNKHFDFATEAALIAEAIGEGRLKDAQPRITEFREVSGAGLLPSEAKMLEELEVQIAARARESAIQRIRDEAQRLEEQNQLEAALGRIARGLQQFEGNTALRADEQRLAEEIEYRAALATARAAENRGDLAAAITAWQNVDRMRPTDENKQTIARLRSEQAFEQARQAEMAGDFELAERKATESLGYMDNQAARSLLDRIGAQVEQSDMMRQAAQAYAAGNYDQAINIYQQVINQFGASADVQRLINQSRVRSAVEKAKVALNSWELATADDLLSEALDIDSTDPEANRLLADLQTRQAYTDRMNRADALRSRGFYGQAKELYAEAIRIAADAGLDTSKAQARLDETEFEHLLANAETAIQAEKWQVALSYLEPARKMRQTNEVVEKIRLAQQKLAEEQE